jgi:hypothetical protein
MQDGPRKEASDLGEGATMFTADAYELPVHRVAKTVIGDETANAHLPVQELAKMGVR